ncbi:MAG: hypothetical protein WBB76_11515 [Gaiellaceae bacterium]
MEPTKRPKAAAALATLAATFAALLAFLTGPAAGATTPLYPADACSDPNVDCGSAEYDGGVSTESWAAYEYSRGMCRTRWARATRRNLAWIIVFQYTEQVRWCWNGGRITYFWRDRWPSDTKFGWTFDGHIGTNCTYEHCSGRGVGAYSADAWTQGSFHACITWFCVHKYPIIDIWVNGDGGSGASASGA